MNLAALHHVNWLEYREALPDGRLRIRLRAAKGDLKEVTLLYVGIYSKERYFNQFNRQPMFLRAQDQVHDWFEADYLPDDPRTCYLFEIKDQDKTLYFDQEGIKIQTNFDSGYLGINPFPYAYIWQTETTPAWARGGIGYQVFPDRFRRGGESVPGLEPWAGGKVNNAVRYGGDLKGITAAVPYLAQLGVDILYLTPIFLSDTAHRYNVYDYYQIDPLLGSLEDLKALADALHARGMRLILDGVFNHSGTLFPPFVDAQKRGADSPYAQWFCFDNSQIGYQTFAFAKYMPKLNLQNEEAAQYFLKVGRYWIREAGIDGWRLDVSPEVWPDFWRRFRKAIKEEKADAILIAECWDISREWVSVGDMFDGTMHYILSRAIWKFFATREINLQQFDWAVNHAQMLYSSGVNQAQWVFLSSHDTPRFLTRSGGDLTRLRMAAFFQLTSPGVPVIYYGDELGMEGEQDPDCRRPMRWDWVDKNNSTLAYYRQLTGIRKQLKALQTGDFYTVETGEDGLYAYLRDGKQPVLCVLCTGDATCERSLTLPPAFANAKKLYDWISQSAIPQAKGKVSLKIAPGLTYIITGNKYG